MTLFDQGTKASVFFRGANGTGFLRGVLIKEYREHGIWLITADKVQMFIPWQSLIYMQEV